MRRYKKLTAKKARRILDEFDKLNLKLYGQTVFRLVEKI
ncbi:hypothetical protein SDC9_180555 [bioreactor metagenome]|uniref:Uncharacterized protein n=1 Tax=bioreactor metagenome TaxID=1076179 RepID=A0A645H421_9ZZZZ